MKTIYRVHLKGDVTSGMYMSRKSSIMSNLYEEHRHPAPGEDQRLGWYDLGPYFARGKYLFGFATLNQLRSWIYKKKWREQIADDGFIISMLSVEDRKVGDTQAIFDSTKHYEVVKEISLTSL